MTASASSRSERWRHAPTTGSRPKTGRAWSRRLDRSSRKRASASRASSRKTLSHTTRRPSSWSPPTPRSTRACRGRVSGWPGSNRSVPSPRSFASSKRNHVGVIARYREHLPVGPSTPEVDLHEGSTPLVASRNIGRALGLKHLYFKYEGLNPTGSFKDRGMVVAVAKAPEEKSRLVIGASTGNTSASMAAYAARTGARAIVVVPSGAGPAEGGPTAGRAQGALPDIAMNKLSQALMYGAKVVALRGNFDHALETV